MPDDALNTSSLASGVIEMEPALWVRRGAPPTMERPHRHDDLELNVVLRGRLDYLFGGSHVSVAAGQIAVFWAATPHRLIDPQQGDVCWVHVPLATVLSWPLPEDDVSTLLRMDPAVVPMDAVPGDVEALFESWRHELTEDHAEIALLEAQAVVRRVLKHHRESPPGPDAPAHHISEGERAVAVQHVATMARFIATTFRQPITTTDVAQAVHLAPTYAMGLFRKAVGTTVGGYILKCRLAEAQRLLITTTLTTGDIAYEAGFSSQSSFYEHFRRMCACSPGEYRRHRHRPGQRVTR
ncbi:helix-turn-helix domain-containing protein [Georgenia alba]|uniref:Helix-turn-helix domain-containing protein n=1 Tax=Georgenia alba TaxID=2233858 RepID=A0ABW2Q8Y0_9MICO